MTAPYGVLVTKRTYRPRRTVTRRVSPGRVVFYHGVAGKNDLDLQSGRVRTGQSKELRTTIQQRTISLGKLGGNSFRVLKSTKP